MVVVSSTNKQVGAGAVDWAIGKTHYLMVLQDHVADQSSTLVPGFTTADTPTFTDLPGFVSFD